MKLADVCVHMVLAVLRLVSPATGELVSFIFTFSCVD
jgi:hypothetical protein